VVYEVVVQSIDPDRRDEYIENYKKAWRALALDGWRGGSLLRCTEKPDRVIIVLEWDSVEAHRQHRGPVMDRFLQEAVRPYQTALSDFDHYIVEDI
jgi:quinol monooxygenase YgiN